MKTVNKSRDLYELVRGPLAGEEHDKLVLVTLDRSNGVTGIHWLGFGSDSDNGGNLEKARMTAVINKADAVALAHGHSSEDIKPSANDIRMTEKIHLMFSTLDIALVDHIIVSDGGYFSFAEGTRHSSMRSRD